MRSTTALPDLSLQISPPSVSDCKAKEMGYDGLSMKPIYSDRSSTTDSGSSGSDLSHENGYSNPGHGEPTLSLGFEMADLGHHHLQLPRNLNHHQQHHQYQPQIYGRDFKRNGRIVNGQGQTDMSLNQRTGIVDLDGRLSSGKADSNPSYSLKPSTTSPQPTPQRTQSGSWLSSTETNNLSMSSPGNGLTFRPDHDSKVDGDKAILHVSDRMKERLDSSNTLSPSDMFLNLEFTLGRPSWQMDYAESSNELTLLKC
ncbi:putative transcription factor KAN4-like protein [Corchorus capsularis]|uniref:Putative transcription factor KAN4-like protein n=1 Tax=Corchorus capsularis TaxID=210143 RepID=A0A1R3IYL5_COCAP|nr:putative transcription factor KAN4-like protein [Corchorus capsularis]